MTSYGASFLKYYLTIYIYTSISLTNNSIILYFSSVNYINSFFPFISSLNYLSKK